MVSKRMPTFAFLFSSLVLPLPFLTFTFSHLYFSHLYHLSPLPSLTFTFSHVDLLSR